MLSGQSGIVKRMDARVLAEVAIMTALASVLYATKVFTLPQGGSITLGSMVPIFLISFRRGPKVGILTGVIFSLVVLYLEPFVYNPIQFLLDYPLAFGSLGLAGFFRSRLIVGVGVGIGARFICHFFSGLIFFASYAPAGESPALYSAIYNASYLIPEFFISAIVIYALAKRNILTVGIPVKPSRTQA